MAGPTPRKRLCLDTNFLFDLAREQDFAQEFRETFLQKGYELLVPPTAAYELDVIRAVSEDAKEREWARIALVNLQGWPTRPFDLDSPSEVIAEKFARELL